MPALIKRTALLILVIVGITFLCRTIIAHGFGVSLESAFWYRDYFGNLAVTLLIAALVQSVRKTLVLAGVVIIMFQLSNAAKLSILGTPASPDDFFNIQNFFFLTDGWRRIVLFCIAAIPFVLAVAFIPWQKMRLWLVLCGMGLVGFLINANSESLRIVLDKHIGNSVWNQPANYRDRGLALHLTQEVVRTISKVEKPPAREEVANALDALARTPTTNALRRELEPELTQALGQQDTQPGRNVHVFVLESFFDPLTLGTQWVPEDPLPADFRQLWDQTGKSAALSPVFGGYTANAEFETLCGFPVTRNAVFFEGWLRNSSPCLPRLLADAGYHSVASHPNVPGFWNRTNAYKLIGFDEYLSKADFDLTDSVGTLLMDRSLYSQIFEYIDQSKINAPVFNYMLTYHGHLPYPSSESYPDQVKAGQESTLLHGYLNQIWYKSRDLMERLAVLREQDPDALIVIFGDHLPYLGPNYGVYDEAWGLPDDRSDFSGEQLQRLTSTPLIVIDGKRGPLNLGDMPLYRLPSLAMSLLGLSEPEVFDTTQNPDNIVVRPVYGMHYTVSGKSTSNCVEPHMQSSPCDISEPWLNQVKVLTGDLFTGEQFILE